MNQQHSLGGIPIAVHAVPVSQRTHWMRRATQFGFIALALLIPISGLLRVDPVAGAFVILDRQIWWSDFFLIFGVWMLLASLLVAAYSYLGTAFCGWACPQNTLAEWANRMTQNLLGKRAEVSLEGARMQVARAKNRLFNWLLLGAMILAVSMFFSLIPLFYFYPPGVVWSFVSFQPDARLAPSLHYIYTIFVLVVFVDVAFIRHFWCRFMCVYKVWQHGFKTKQTLHIDYDAARGEECLKCNYCVTACFLDLDPKQTNVYDSCINCGECIIACNQRQAKKGQSGLLRFAVGDEHFSGPRPVSNAMGNLSERLKWTMLFSATGLAMFGWGVWSYDHYHLAVYRADMQHGAQIQDYRVAVSHKIYDAAAVRVSVDGLAAGTYELSATQALFTTAERVDLNLHVRPALPRGVHAFWVRVESVDGWRDSYRVQHFVGGD